MDKELVCYQSADTVADLEQHIVQLKQALEKSEEQRQRQSRVSKLLMHWATYEYIASCTSTPLQTTFWRCLGFQLT